MSSTRIGFYGPGNMGQKLISHLTQFASNEFEFLVYHPRLDRIDELVSKFKLMPADLETIGQVDALFLCVKPAQIKTVCKTLQPHLSSETVIISILAGVPKKYLQDHLETDKVVRIMLTIAVNSTSSRLFAFGESELIQPLTKFFSVSMLHSDAEVDRATAVYGCGPAFVAEFFQMYVRSSRLFFPSDQDSTLLPEEWTLEMFTDTLKTLHKMKPSDLISKVACQGGATEEALKVMRDGDLNDTLWQTLRSAYTRAEQLGQSLSQ